MVKRMLILFLIVFTLLLNSSCSLNNETVDNGASKANLAIYLVKDMKTSEAIEEDINKLDLEDEPILSDKNISEYIWKEHKIKFLEDEKLKETLREKVNMKVPTSGKPFVLVCNNDRIYVGSFWTLLSSLSGPRCPTIVSDFIDRNYFEVGYNFIKGDKRNDKRVYEALKELGKLK